MANVSPCRDSQNDTSVMDGLECATDILGGVTPGEDVDTIYTSEAFFIDNDQEIQHNSRGKGWG